MLASITSLLVSYALGVGIWYLTRLYYQKRGIAINTYHTITAAFLSIIATTIIANLAQLGRDGCFMSGLVVAVLFSLDANPETTQTSRKKILLYMLLGGILGAVVWALMEQAQVGGFS